MLEGRNTGNVPRCTLRIFLTEAPEDRQLKDHHIAAVVELVDTLASGASDRKVMRVRVSPAAPHFTQTPGELYSHNYQGIWS